MIVEEGIHILETRQARSKMIVAQVSAIEIQLIRTVSRSKFVMRRARKMNLGHRPHAYILEDGIQI